MNRIDWHFLDFIVYNQINNLEIAVTILFIFLCHCIFYCLDNKEDVFMSFLVFLYLKSNNIWRNKSINWLLNNSKNSFSSFFPSLYFLNSEHLLVANMLWSWELFLIDKTRTEEIGKEVLEVQQNTYKSINSGILLVIFLTNIIYKTLKM